MQEGQIPEWLCIIMAKTGDPFGAALWDAVYVAEECYAQATLPQLHILERMYGESHQQIVMGLVREAAHRAGVELRETREGYQERICVKDIGLSELLSKIRGV